MKKLSIFFFSVCLLASACTDPELDPLQLDKLKQGNIITLRGAGLDNLSLYVGAVDAFNPNGDIAAENFEFECDYLSVDVNSLQEVEIFAFPQGGNRTKVKTVPGSDFKAVQGSAYPRASISVSLNDVLNAIGKKATDFSSKDTNYENDYIYFECDLTLKDGSKTLASSVVNSSLFESAHFYPAHSLLYYAQD